VVILLAICGLVDINGHHHFELFQIFESRSFHADAVDSKKYDYENNL
jgi:hypothetical protein